MRRDMAIILAILEAVEKLPYEPDRGFSPFSLNKLYPEEALLYHARLCHQAKLVTMGRAPFIKELTWRGHELLAQLRRTS